MEDLIQLLMYWDEYKKSRQNTDFSRFGQWLDQYASMEKSSVKEYGAGADGVIGFLLGNLFSYSEAWTKLALKNLPLAGLTDFRILKYVEKNQNPTKKSIANNSVAGDSTIFESIKRLQKQGFINEKEDASDRRVKRVSLTSAGMKLSKEATAIILNLSTLFVGDLSSVEKEQLAGLLRKLVSFHRDLHQHTKKEQIAIEYRLQ
ncbi:MAG: MarR family winged helix-turn-helix transcriptional regulator [Cyclobacteriaceae bacterium]